MYPKIIARSWLRTRGVATAYVDKKNPLPWVIFVDVLFFEISVYSVFAHEGLV